MKKVVTIQCTVAARCFSHLGQFEAIVNGELRREVLHANELWPRGLIRRAKRSEDAEEMINLRIRLEEGTARCSFSQEAPHRPSVHFRPVDLISEHELWRTVPQSLHLSARTIPLFGILWRVGLEGNVEHPSRCEVSKLHCAVLVQKEIVWLQVAVHDALMVQVGESCKDLPELDPDINAALQVHHAIQPLVPGAEILMHILRAHHGSFTQDFRAEVPDHIWMLELGQKRSLAQEGSGHAVILARIGELQVHNTEQSCLL
mmetsp:Transcript_82766/g.146157  ORF Transcript_82766/g.146157 Transcript_82766/m.146157 type:complete len:260 (-) Transcript_82766:583-1362(-)